MYLCVRVSQLIFAQGHASFVGNIDLGGLAGKRINLSIKVSTQTLVGNIDLGGLAGKRINLSIKVSTQTNGHDNSPDKIEAVKKIHQP